VLGEVETSAQTGVLPSAVLLFMMPRMVFPVPRFNTGGERWIHNPKAKQA